jgi:hypothetical protein
MTAAGSSALGSIFVVIGSQCWTEDVRSLPYQCLVYVVMVMGGSLLVHSVS